MQFPREKHALSRLAAPAAALVVAGAFLGCAFLLHAAESNPRWSFLVTNLEVFPGMEKIFEPDASLFWRLKPNLQEVRAAERLPDTKYPFQVSTDADGRRRLPSRRWLWTRTSPWRWFTWPMSGRTLGWITSRPPSGC